jgi:hypothetical protein
LFWQNVPSTALVSLALAEWEFGDNRQPQLTRDVLSVVALLALTQLERLASEGRVNSQVFCRASLADSPSLLDLDPPLDRRRPILA